MTSTISSRRAYGHRGHKVLEPTLALLFLQEKKSRKCNFIARKRLPGESGHLLCLMGTGALR